MTEKTGEGCSYRGAKADMTIRGTVLREELPLQASFSTCRADITPLNLKHVEQKSISSSFKVIRTRREGERMRLIDIERKGREIKRMG